MNKKGFAPIAIILIIVGVLVVAGGVWWWQKAKVSAPIATSALSPTPTPSAPTDETANWQTYRNEQYGFEVKYPAKLTQWGSDKNPSDKFGVEFRYNCPVNVVPALNLGVRITVADYSDKSSITNWIKNYENEEFFNTKTPNINRFIDFSVNGCMGKRIVSLGRTYYKVGIIEDRVILPKGSEMFIIDGFWDGQGSVASSSNGQECIGEIRSIFNQILSTFRFTDQDQIECNTNSDCQNGASCMVEGPIIANQPVHKICVPKGQAVPL